MRFADYIKDRMFSGALTLSGWLAMFIFFGAYRIGAEASAVISIVYFITAAASLTADYLRKRRFYRLLEENLDALDKKYLVSEMVSEPEFLEGRILCKTLRTANKSMCENVSRYRRESEGFREYIELWVHEIKIPVAGLELMCHNDGNTRYSAQLHQIDDYIENVLYYARSGSAEKDYVINESSLKRLFSEAALRSRSQLQERGVHITAEGLDVNVVTDAKWLLYIFGQLFCNSLKYFSADREPRIDVFTERLPDRVILHFKDNGIGIPESDIPYIFEKSFTGANGRAGKKSTGMGLYIVKKVCGKLGHSVSADSVRGEYTDILITFGKNDHNKIE